MIEFRNNRTLRIKRIIALVLSVTVFLATFAVYFDYRLRKVVVAFAKSSAKTVILNCANSGAEKVLAKTDISYDTIAVVSRNNDGLATSVEIDAIAANKIKAQISAAIAEELAAYEAVEFQVPITAAFGWYIKSFWTPKLSYSVHITTTIGSNLKSNFIGAGINQVLHQIILTINLESGLAMPKEDTELTTFTEYIIAQTVIVGAVPDAFTSVGHATDEVMEDIFDFGAGQYK